ncbi:hypothetical protein GS483_19580 [Rhodococcus hoagii]|nr:hypothetical protein [Prescottella equi]
MPKFTAPHDFRDEAVHIGVHTIALDDRVGHSDALNAGEVAYLRGRGFTVTDEPKRKPRAARPAPRKPSTSAPTDDTEPALTQGVTP